MKSYNYHYETLITYHLKSACHERQALHTRLARHRRHNLVGLVASGYTSDEILKLYPYLEAEDLTEALAYAAWRAEEIEVTLAA